MAAIITDQLRVLNAGRFVSGITSGTDVFYSFVGLTNSDDISSSWNDFPFAPKDSFDEENNTWDTIVALKKINSEDVSQVIRKITWESGIKYDMYRHDITRDNLSQPSQATSLYSANYYVVNSDYRVYICLQNGNDPENPQGRPSLDEPTFTDLEPRAAGNSGDGYIWKYLYTIKPSEIAKFDGVNFIPVPKNWKTDSTYAPIRNNARDGGQLKVVTIKNRGVGVGTANREYRNVPIKGDGTGAEVTIIVNNDSKVESITISKGGSGYTFGTVDLVSGNVPTGTTRPVFDVIVPPQGGHGADIYRELGAQNVLLYSRIENDTQNPDFIVGNKIARVGIVCNPLAFNSTELLTTDKVSALSALKLTGPNFNTATFSANSFITQTVGTGVTAVGRVVSYDQQTGVLKYWRDRTTAGFTTAGEKVTNPPYGFDQVEFTASPLTGGSLTVVGQTSSLSIDSVFTGITTSINNRTYYLGQQFTNGVSNPEIKKYSGSIIHVDNRPAITRSPNQKEDIKVILQF
jgi:hypothetical protein